MQAGGMQPVATSEQDEGFLANEHIQALLERLRREPALRAWVLTAPTGALATLGVVLDDNELVQLLERIEALDERSLPVTAADVMTRPRFCPNTASAARRWSTPMAVSSGSSASTT